MGFFSKITGRDKRKRRERKAREEAERQQREIQSKLKVQREAHSKEMASIEKIISELKGEGQTYTNTALESQKMLKQNNEAIAQTIHARSGINLQQEEDSQQVIDKKKKNRTNSGVTKADML